MLNENSNTINSRFNFYSCNDKDRCKFQTQLPILFLFQFIFEFLGHKISFQDPALFSWTWQRHLIRNSIHRRYCGSETLMVDINRYAGMVGYSMPEVICMAPPNFSPSHGLSLKIMPAVLNSMKPTNSVELTTVLTHLSWHLRCQNLLVQCGLD